MVQTCSRFGINKMLKILISIKIEKNVFITDIFFFKYLYYVE